MSVSEWTERKGGERLRTCPNCGAELPRSHEVTLFRTDTGVIAGNTERVRCRQCPTLIEYGGVRVPHPSRDGERGYGRGAGRT